MSQSVFLHVGLPKSGTTYLQKVFTANKQALMDQAGLLFPGPVWHDQVKAVQDVRQMRVAADKRRDVRGAWDRLVKEIADWEGNAVVSMEWLCAAEPKHVQQMLDDLSPGRVEVVFTVRDLGRTLPAAWQEFMQNRGEWSWHEFLEGVAAQDRSASSAGARFWSQQDIAALLANWMQVIPAAQVHVVTLPHPGVGPGVLWERVCEVLGIEHAGYLLDGPSGNVSLGLESAELMRRLNPLARASGLRKSLYHQVFKHGMAKRVLAERRNTDSMLGLPVAYHDWAREGAAQQVKAVQAAHVHVVGDLQDLEPALDTTGTRQPEEVPDGVLFEACLGGLITMARQWDTARTEAREQRLENMLLQERLERSRKRAEHLQARLQHFESHPVRATLGPRLRRVRGRLRSAR